MQKENQGIITNEIITLLEEKGWTLKSLGKYRSSGEIKEKGGFKVFTRRRNLKQYIDDSMKKSSSLKSKKQYEDATSEVGSKVSIGNQKGIMTPETPAESSLPTLSAFSKFPSLVAIRKDSPCLLIGYDSEWQMFDDGRMMLSWQFALVDGVDLVETIFIKDGDKDLSLDDALGFILDHLESYKPVDIRELRRYEYCSGWNGNKPILKTTDNLDEARHNAKYIYLKDIGFTHELISSMEDKTTLSSKRNWLYFRRFNNNKSIKNIPITLVCHTGEVDISGLSDNGTILKHLKPVQGGLISQYPIKFTPHSSIKVNNTYIYPVSLSISDTMCHAPSGKKSLANLGTVLGVEKISLPKKQKRKMLELLTNNPVLYMEYASTDSVITMLYSSALYGYNNALPMTLTSAGAGVMKDIMMEHLGCNDTSDFNRIYRGLEKVDHGKVLLEDRPVFLENSSLEPINNDAMTVQQYASLAYTGGYNSCSEVGYFPFETFDYDLRTAYPTAMCLVPDINWDKPIHREIINEEMSLDDFKEDGKINPLNPFVGYIEFEFPSDCKYPCIPVKVEGVPVYPITSDGLNGVYVAGPAIWLALRLGARIICKRGYFLNILYRKGISEKSHSLAKTVKELVVDRKRAKKIIGDNSLEQLILKTLVNSFYGKTAQNVIQKHEWSAYKDAMETLGCSAVTNPVAAMMTTSIVQVILIATLNQIDAVGYHSYSVTTDGFISDCPSDIIRKLDLYGLKPYIESARLFLTDGEDKTYWEIKHKQNDLINITTRGNVSLQTEREDRFKGVCAHNSCKSSYTSDTYADRVWLAEKTLSRTGAVSCTALKFTSFKDLVHGKPFLPIETTRNVHMDFDLKRKPLRNSFHTDIVPIKDKTYDIAHFNTIPYKDIAEFRLYRTKKKDTDVLRTEEDWACFFLKVDLEACQEGCSQKSNARPRDWDWAILNSCIMLHRMGHVDIPGLNNKSVAERCEWINAHNTSKKLFKPSDWKNSRRADRQVNVLPMEIIKEKLDELIHAE